MNKYTAVTKNGNQIISVFAEDRRDAKRQITIHLRGRPGRLDFYKKWKDDGEMLWKK